MIKNKRYNILVICLLFIISIVVGISAGMSAGTSVGMDYDSVIEQELPDGVVVGNDSNEEIPTGLVMPQQDASAFERIKFAIDVMESGKGFTSYVSQNLNAVGQVQQMSFKKYRSGSLDLSEEWFKMDGLMSGMGKNEFRSWYSNGTMMKYKTITNSANFNFDKKTYVLSACDKLEEFSVENYVTVQNRTPMNDFFTIVDDEHGTVEKYDKRSDANNYIVRVRLNTSKLDAKYLSTFTANGGGNIDIKSLVLTFKISKNTGFLASLEKVEVFGATYFGIEAICQTTLKETFLTMNTSCEETIRNTFSQSFNS